MGQLAMEPGTSDRPVPLDRVARDAQGGGGVFNRAEGLAEEIGADLWATTPRELIEKMCTQADRRATAEQRTVGRNRRAVNAA